MKHGDAKLRVLVVWEPILPSDWRPPTGSTLSRISDPRAQQFWDPQHTVADALRGIAERKPPSPAPACCVQRGFFWDQAIVYAPRAHWKEEPPAVFWNGAVVRVIPGLEHSLEELAAKSQ